MAIVSAMVLVSGAVGWCGGPVTSRAPGADALPPGQQPGPGMSAGDQGGIGALSMSGGAGSSYANGANGVSPWVNYDSVGLRDAFTYALRGRYEPQMFGLNLGINGEYLASNFSGETAHWDGYTGHPILTSGAGASAKLDISLVTVSADFGVSDLVLGRGSAIQIGPRILWTQYTDTFKLENTRTQSHVQKSRSFAMFGVGLIGVFDLARLSGMSFSSPYGSSSPEFSFVASLAKGSSMRYYNWEVWLKIFQTSGDAPYYNSGGYFPMPEIAAEIGWIRYDFDETIEEDTVTQAGLSRDGNANYSLNIPMIRGIVTF